jgi:single-strand DNA-binding protein
MALAKMGLAVNRRFKDRNGEQKEDTAFVDLEAWGKTAEFCSQYLKKGKRVYVEGRLKYDRWETSDGAKRSKLNVSVERIQFADTRPAEHPAGIDESQPDVAPVDLPQSSSASSSRSSAPTPPREADQSAGVQESDATADDLPF